MKFFRDHNFLISGRRRLKSILNCSWESKLSYITFKMPEKKSHFWDINENVKSFREVAANVNNSVWFLKPSPKFYKTAVYPCSDKFIYFKIQNIAYSKYVEITLVCCSLISKQHFELDSSNKVIIKDLHPWFWYLPLINYVCYLIKFIFLC